MERGVEKIKDIFNDNTFISHAEKRLKRANLNDQQIFQTYMMPFKATKDIQLSI